MGSRESRKRELGEMTIDNVLGEICCKCQQRNGDGVQESVGLLFEMKDIMFFAHRNNPIKRENMMILERESSGPLRVLPNF